MGPSRIMPARFAMSPWGKRRKRTFPPPPKYRPVRPRQNSTGHRAPPSCGRGPSMKPPAADLAALGGENRLRGARGGPRPPTCPSPCAATVLPLQAIVVGSGTGALFRPKRRHAGLAPAPLGARAPSRGQPPRPPPTPAPAPSPRGAADSAEIHDPLRGWGGGVRGRGA